MLHMYYKLYQFSVKKCSSIMIPLAPISPHWFGPGVEGFVNWQGKAQGNFWEALSMRKLLWGRCTRALSIDKNGFQWSTWALSMTKLVWAMSLGFISWQNGYWESQWTFLLVNGKQRVVPASSRKQCIVCTCACVFRDSCICPQSNSTISETACLSCCLGC